MRVLLASIIVLSIVMVRPARAEPAGGAAAETNVLWPFFPGGISELKLLLPAAHRGDALVGLWSDFANRKPARDETYGKVSTLAIKLGYRQHLWRGLHLEAAATIGWRHEAMRPNDDPVIDDFVMRAWPFLGWQHDLSPRWYVNARGGVGIHLYRSSRSEKERKLVPGGDLNVGVRF
jgi:hypothetical protein